jgi:MFS family permease
VLQRVRDDPDGNAYGANCGNAGLSERLAGRRSSASGAAEVRPRLEAGMYVSVRSAPVKLRSLLSLKGVSTTVITLGWVSLITDVSSEMVAAVLPLFVMLELGLSPAAYGAIDGAYQAGSVLARLVGGYLGDLRQPKWVAMAGYAISAGCKLLLTVAASFGSLFAIISLDRCGKGLRTAPRDAMIAASSSSDELGRAFGVHRTMDTLGAFLGPLLAWALLLVATDDFNLIFLVSFCIATAAVVLISFLQPEKAGETPVADAEAKIEIGRAELLAVLTERRYLALGLACVALSLSTISDGFLYLIILRADAASAARFPLLFVGTNLAYLIFALPVGNMADQIGRRRVFLVGHVSLLAAYLGSALLAGAPAVTSCLVFLGLYYAATDGMLPAVATPLLPPRLRATGLSVLQSLTAIGKAVSAVLFGFAWSLFGAGGALSIFATALLVSLLAAVLLLRTPREERVR